MDAVVVGAVAGLTTFVSRHLPAPANRSFFARLSLGLSFSLFGLGVLDASPSSWNLILGQTEGALTHVTLAMAYSFMLWGIASMVVVLGPCLVGGYMAGTLVSLSSWFGKLRFIGIVVSATKVYRLLSAVAASVSRLVCCKTSLRGQALPTHNNVSKSKENKSISSRSTRDLIWRLFGGLIGVFFTASGLLSLGPTIVRIHFDQGQHDLSLLTQVISCLCAVGIIISAILNGFGSVSLPFSCLGGFFLEPVSSEAVAAAERELERARSSLGDRRKELSKENMPSTVGTGRHQSSLPRSLSWMSGSAPNSRNLSSADMNEVLVQRRKQLSAEINFLQALVNDLGDDVAEMRLSKRRAAEARTPMGRFRLLIGIIFSFVLVIRLLAATFNVFYATNKSLGDSSRESSDPVSTALLFMAGREMVSRDSFETLSQVVSLLLTACLSVSQVRTFLRTVSAVDRLVSNWYRKCYCVPDLGNSSSSLREGGRRSALYILVASLMMCYCLACSVMTKNMLPIDYRYSFSRALEGSEVFRVRFPVVNRVFLSSAAVSVLILGVLLGIQRQNTQRYSRTVLQKSDERSLLMRGEP